MIDATEVVLWGVLLVGLVLMLLIGASSLWDAAWHSEKKFSDVDDYATRNAINARRLADGRGARPHTERSA